MKKVLCFIMALILTFSFSSVAFANDQITKDQYYARSTLSGNELQFYDEIFNGIENKDQTINVSEYKIDKEAVNSLIISVYNDTPEQFFLNSTFKWYYNSDDIVTDVYFDYIYSNNELQEKQKEIDIATSKALEVIGDGMSDYEKVKALYVYVSTHITFERKAEADINAGKENLQTSESQTIIGGLVNGKAVCSGIARTFQYLLYKEGIPCYCVDGTRRGADHTWNIVQVDGQWYHCDLTQDLGKKDGFSCFMVNEAIINLTHTFTATDGNNYNPILPECSLKYIPPASTQTLTPTSTSEATAVAVSVEPAPVVTQSPEAVEQPEGEHDNTLWFILGCAVVAVAALVIIILAVRRKKKKF